MTDRLLFVRNGSVIARLTGVTGEMLWDTSNPRGQRRRKIALAREQYSYIPHWGICRPWRLSCCMGTNQELNRLSHSRALTIGVHSAHMKSTILANSIVVAARHQVSCDLAGEVAILDIKSGIYYGLNAVGARIWNLVQEPKTVSEVCEAILEEYDVGADRCERDILALLKELVAKGLIEVRNGTAT